MFKGCQLVTSVNENQQVSVKPSGNKQYGIGINHRPRCGAGKQEADVTHDRRAAGARARSSADHATLLHYRMVNHRNPDIVPDRTTCRPVIHHQCNGMEVPALTQQSKIHKSSRHPAWNHRHRRPLRASTARRPPPAAAGSVARDARRRRRRRPVAPSHRPLAPRRPPARSPSSSLIRSLGSSRLTPTAASSQHLGQWRLGSGPPRVVGLETSILTGNSQGGSMAA